MKWLTRAGRVGSIELLGGAGYAESAVTEPVCIPLIPQGIHWLQLWGSSDHSCRFGSAFMEAHSRLVGQGRPREAALLRPETAEARQGRARCPSTCGSPSESGSAPKPLSKGCD
jgi:hypothetical protein